MYQSRHWLSCCPSISSPCYRVLACLSICPYPKPFQPEPPLPFPSFSHLYYNPAILAICFLGSFCSLDSSFVSSLSCSSHNLLSWPSLSCWLCSFWTLPDAYDCFLPRIYNKILLTGAVMSSFSFTIYPGPQARTAVPVISFLLLILLLVYIFILK